MVHKYILIIGIFHLLIYINVNIVVHNIHTQFTDGSIDLTKDDDDSEFIQYPELGSANIINSFSQDTSCKNSKCYFLFFCSNYYYHQHYNNFNKLNLQV